MKKEKEMNLRQKLSSQNRILTSTLPSLKLGLQQVNWGNVHEITLQIGKCDNATLMFFKVH